MSRRSEFVTYRTTQARTDRLAAIRRLSGADTRTAALDFCIDFTAARLQLDAHPEPPTPPATPARKAA